MAHMMWSASVSRYRVKAVDVVRNMFIPKSPRLVPRLSFEVERAVQALEHLLPGFDHLVKFTLAGLCHPDTAFAEVPNVRRIQRNEGA